MGEWCNRADFHSLLPTLLRGEDPDFRLHTKARSQRAECVACISHDLPLFVALDRVGNRAATGDLSWHQLLAPLAELSCITQPRGGVGFAGDAGYIEWRGSGCRCRLAGLPDVQGRPQGRRGCRAIGLLVLPDAGRRATAAAIQTGAVPDLSPRHTGGNSQRVAVTGSQQLRLAVRAAAPHRADRMDHEFRRQAIAFGELRFTCLAAAQQRGVGGIDDRIDPERGDVALYGAKYGWHE